MITHHPYPDYSPYEITRTESAKSRPFNYGKCIIVSTETSKRSKASTQTDELSVSVCFCVKW